MIDSVYWIWFQLVFGVGTRSAELMMKFFETPEIIANGIGKDRRITSMLEEAELERAKDAMERAKRIKERTLKKGCDIITPDCPLYPECLVNIYSKPMVLYVKGDVSCLSGRLAIAMVGSRKPSRYGLDAAKLIVSGLAAEGVVIISGLAKGIDSACHEAAVESGSKTIGVLGCGIDVDYPKDSASLKRRICENGAVLTEYPLGEQPYPGHFPVRNRIISGLAQGTVVVEAGEASGSLVTAGLAIEQGRDVFAVPGSIFMETYKGANSLIKDGVKPITCAVDVLEEYSDYINISPTMYNEYSEMVNNMISADETPEAPEAQTEIEHKMPSVSRKSLPDSLSPEAALVYEKISDTPISVDEIISGLEIRINTALASLTELELYGFIQIYPGRLFALKNE